MSQNIWEKKKSELYKQKRRAQLVASYIRDSSAMNILDLGCAEGYVTSFISKNKVNVVGIDLDLDYLRIAKKKLKNIDFINASAFSLPCREGTFDAVCILEVLEHLGIDDQRKSVAEADWALKKNGNLIVSVPYKESIIQTNCIHCGKKTPLYGHLRSLDELDIGGVLPNDQYELLKKCHLPNIQLVSCKGLFDFLPLRLWLVINAVLGLVKKGYWVVLHYSKSLK